MEDSKEVYNKYESLPMMSYNCIDYLLNNNEVIWKLLKYTDNNAWKSDASHPNLTKSEKGSLIYDGSEDDTNYRVFMDVGNDNAWDEQVCILRVSPIDVSPNNHVYGTVNMLFEVYSHYKINTLSNYTTRSVSIIQQIIESLNGQDVGGIGRLFFDSNASSRCRIYTSGEIPFKGNVVIMSNRIS